MTSPAPEAHLDPHEVTGYLEGTVAPAERARLEAHLADCEDCAAELAAVSRLRRPARPMNRLAVAVLAAAAIAIIVVGRTLDRRAGDEGPRERGDSVAQTVNVIAPAEGAVLRSPPAFVWSKVQGAATYRVSVTRPDGDSVWAVSLRDTVARAPDAALTAGTYYWFVDALLSDGRSMAGKAREFRIGP
jgi:anti-sigma factor RsiW